jgi:peptidoglycan/LPS O-acetylase OafA/YrhL
MAGMLLRRMVALKAGKNTFLLTGLLLITVLSMPRIGGYNNVWTNGLYEAIVVLFVFPMIIYLGAIGEVKHRITEKICTFLGDISYPLYITHFPFICMYYAWTYNNNITIEQGAPIGVALIIGCIAFAYAALKWYDLPVRKWLANKFIYDSKK